MGISDYISGRRISRVERFQKKLRSVKTKQDQRILEQTMLKPAPLLPYSKELPVMKSSLQGRSVLIVLPDKESMELFLKYFKVSSKPPLSVLNIAKFVKMLKWYDKHKRKKERKNGR